MLLAGLVLFAALGYLHLATRKFAWWKEAAFAGTVVGKQARERKSDAVVAPAAALERPTRHRFFLRIASDNGDTALHEVVPSLFAAAAVGDRVRKRAGRYRVRRIPGAEGPAEEPAP